MCEGDFDQTFNLTGDLGVGEGSFQDKGGHFVRRSNKLQDYTVSKAVDNFALKTCSAPFMSK